MANTIIEVDHLSKMYKLYNSKSDRVREAISWRHKEYYKPFYALHDISFQIEHGEIIGIIGTNGSGKSTLLKILTGVTSATDGKVTVNGKVSALLELGTGFNPEYTGLENIDLTCKMQGCTEDETAVKRKQIIEFADIGEYINQPVKNYSSGMFARLGFAAAVNVDPEILIVDEALSVGDMRFQVKCMDRMKQMMDNGTTILYVSHDISSVRRFCTRCFWINGGRLQAVGEPNRICDMYSDFLRCNDVSLVSDKINHGEHRDEQKAEVEAFRVPDTDAIASIVDFKIEGYSGENPSIPSTVPLFLTVTYDVYDEQVANPVLGIAFFSIDDRYICGLNTMLDKISIPWKYGRNSFSLSYPQGLRVLGGKYYFDVGLEDRTASVFLDYRKCIREISVTCDYIAEGIFVIPHQWE